MFWHCDDLDKTKISPSSWIDIASYKLMNIRTSCIHNIHFLISIDISLTCLLLQAVSLNFKILLISNILIIDKLLLQKKNVVIIMHTLKNRKPQTSAGNIHWASCNVGLWLRLLSSCKGLFGLPVILLVVFLFRRLLGLSCDHRCFETKLFVLSLFGCHLHWWLNHVIIIYVKKIKAIVYPFYVLFPFLSIGLVSRLRHILWICCFQLPESYK